MSTYGIRSIAGSMMLAGLTCLSFGNMNTSEIVTDFNTPAIYSGINDYGTDSSLLKSYPMRAKTFKVEQEAEALFGVMREATLAEQECIQMNIEKISKQIGLNFWEYVE